MANSNYIFALLDPRLQGQGANEAVFAKGMVFGIEVTIPALASRCIFNIDPQHAGGDTSVAAIEEALVCELPPEGAVLATIRPDLDSVGAMALIAHRLMAMQEVLNADRESPLSGCDPLGWKPGEEMLSRIKLVATADTFSRAGYPGPRPLPWSKNPWPEEFASAESSRPLAAMSAAVADFRVPISKRVEMMQQWLLTGEEPVNYRAQVEQERKNLIGALENGIIRRQCNASGRIAVVESMHRAATLVGYCFSPVVVAMNPAFQQGTEAPHRKFTICAYDASYADIKAALAELALLELGWGGSPTIGGSPQGVSSTLTIDQVVAVVEKHLKN